MAKVPQSEWSAIAERHSQGEPISSIARNYGCTAPAIRYILKRAKERAVVSDQRPAPVQTPTKPELSQAARIGGGANDRSNSSLVARRAPTLQQVTAPPGAEHRDRGSEPGFTPSMAPAPTEPNRAAAPQAQRGKTQPVRRAVALTAGLDAELRADAEAAIQAFRSSFDVALAENVPITRERLRQAASDLMRVAARTTIVLDRLNAGARPAALRD